MQHRKEPKTAAHTAKPVLAVKRYTSQPTFWQARGCGGRNTPLSHNEAADLFLTETDKEHARTRHDIDQIKTVSVRERWVNKIAEHYVKQEGYQQVVILGAGYDIQAHKKNVQNQQGKKNAAKYAQVTFWEIDQAEILDDKAKIFMEAGLDKNATYLSMDYTKEDFIASLAASGLNLSAPTLIIFEGNSMYLEKNQLKEVFVKISRALPQAVIAFDYFSQVVIDQIAQMAARRGQGNEFIWKSGIDNLEQFAQEAGLSVIKKQTIADLAKEYDVDRAPPYNYHDYSVTTLGR